MPKLSEFFGIAIYMYYREHAPPHFHAFYGGEQAEIGIEGLQVLAGSLPPRALGLVVEWASLHQDELRRAWEQAVAHQPLDRIAPLV
ncbi:MAG TPA: DUF4160 domain-containing protein [Polyangia bacterium]|jgi:hypothetical protein